MIGNLKGSRQVVKDFGGRMYDFIGFDGGMTHCQANLSVPITRLPIVLMNVRSPGFSSK